MSYQKPSCEQILFTQMMILTLSEPDSSLDNETPRVPMP